MAKSKAARQRARLAQGSGSKPQQPKQVERRSAPTRKGTRSDESLSVVGRDIGSRLGGAVGNLLGGGISRLFGMGDYKLYHNSLISAYGGESGAGAAPPMMFRGPNHGTRIVEREYLGSVTSSTTFNNTVYAINPSNPTTFPWLSKIADRFEQWEPNGIVFEYRTTSSEFNGSSQALGTVILATDYDPRDDPYASKVEATNSDYAITVKSSDNAVHGIECDPNIRPARVLYCSASTDPYRVMLSNLGTFQLGTDGMTDDGVVLGELWISYDITFYKKQLRDSQSADLHVLTAVGTTGYSIGSPFGTDATLTAYDGSGVLDSFSLTQGSGATTTFTLINEDLASYLLTAIVEWDGSGALNGPGLTAPLTSGFEVVDSLALSAQGNGVTLWFVLRPTAQTCTITHVPTTLTGCTGLIARYVWSKV